MKMKNLLLLLVLAILLFVPDSALATVQEPLPGIQLNVTGMDEPNGVSVTIQLLLLLTILSLAPAILIMMTSFTRIVVVLAFTRNALATQQMPPNQVLIGLALFLTLFIMSPVLADVNEQALQPFLNGELSQEEALDRAAAPMKEFMGKFTRQKDLALFISYAQMEQVNSVQEIPLTALVPAYALSELRTAFTIGFFIFVPFLVIDMVVASILMGMGMMMLPPVMISLPFKILLFVLVDGWYLVFKTLIMSFN